MINLCKNFEVTFLPVLTKSDKLTRNKVNKTISLVNNEILDVSAIAVSSKDMSGFDKLHKQILEFIK